jgi:UDP-N-acetyl-D-mannosaminuronic acid transferase (WecB/TagA/CpsF family)
MIRDSRIMIGVGQTIDLFNPDVNYAPSWPGTPAPGFNQS